MHFGLTISTFDQFYQVLKFLILTFGPIAFNLNFGIEPKCRF